MPSYQHTSPNVFVGRFNYRKFQQKIYDSKNSQTENFCYPNISVGILNTKEIKDHDKPKFWAKRGFGLKHIIPLRQDLINSSFQGSIKKLKGKESKSLLKAIEKLEGEIKRMEKYIKVLSKLKLS